MKTMKALALIFILFLLGCNSKAQSDTQTYIDNLFSKATQADSIGDYKKSIEIYSQILTIDTDYGGALINRGRAYIFLGDTTQGFIDLNNAIKYHPHERAYSTRGIAYLYINQLDSAKTDLNTALKLNPLFSEAYYFLSSLDLIKEEYLPALYNCELADKYGMNETMSTALKVEMIKVLGKNIVSNFNYEKIIATISNISMVKKAEEKSLAQNNTGFTYGVKMKKETRWLYIITVKEKDKQRWVFKMEADTLKVLNPNGKV